MASHIAASAVGRSIAFAACLSRPSSFRSSVRTFRRRSPALIFASTSTAGSPSGPSATWPVGDIFQPGLAKTSPISSYSRHISPRYRARSVSSSSSGWNEAMTRPTTCRLIPCFSARLVRDTPRRHSAKIMSLRFTTAGLRVRATNLPCTCSRIRDTRVTGCCRGALRGAVSVLVVVPCLRRLAFFLACPTCADGRGQPRHAAMASAHTPPALAGTAGTRNGSAGIHPR